MVHQISRTAAVIAGGALVLAGAMVTPAMQTQAAQTRSAQTPATDPSAHNRCTTMPAPSLEIEELGPVETEAAMNAFAVGEGPDGREVMLVQGGTKAARTVIGVVDPLTGELLDSVRLPNIIDSLSPLTGPDGRLYVPGFPGDYDNTNLVAIDPLTLEVEDLGKAIESETHIARMQVVGNEIWAGTFPNAHIQSYDIETGEYTDHGTIDEDEWYARSIAHDGDHTIYVGTEGSGRIIQWDLDSGQRVDLPLPPEMNPYDYRISLMSYQGGLLFAFFGASADWHVYDIDAGDWIDVLRSNPPSMPTEVDPETNRMYFASNGDAGLHYFDFDNREFGNEGWEQALSSSTAGAGLQLMDLDHADWPGLTVVGQGRNGGIWRYNPATEHAEMQPDAELPESGMLIRALHIGPDDKTYFGLGYNSGFLTRYNAESGEFERQSPFTTSQVHNFLTASDGTMYLSSYSHAGLLQYDPAEPYEWGVNPRQITNFGEQMQDRLFGLTEAGGKIVVGGSGQRGHEDGILAVYDPQSDEVTRHEAPLPGHQIMSLETVGEVVYGGTSILTPGADPVEDESKIFAFDPETGEVLWETVPFPGNETISELTAREDGKLWGLTNDDVAFLFDPRTRQVLREVEVGPGGSFDGLSVLNEGVDGCLYGGTASGSIFRLDPRTGRTVQFDEPGVAISQAADGSLHWTDGANVYIGELQERRDPPAADGG